MKQYTKGSSGNGNPLETTDAKKIYAKEVDNKYYLLLDVENQVFDPNGITKATGSSSRYPVKFTKVNKATFDSYLTYLATGKKSVLGAVRRKVTYG